MKQICVLILIIIMIIIYFFYKLSIKINNKHIIKKYNITKDTKYFDVEIYPELKDIKKYKNKIHIELNKLLKNDLKDWSDWPEKNLYNYKKNTWKIMPFFYYGFWVKTNCNKMPNLTKFLKSLKNMKISLLSVMSPKTTLNEHKGWGNHSNNVLRCHYGLKVPNNCYINVKNDNDIFGTIKPHRKDEWLIFDDSKLHYASNDSDYYRIVLIIDIDRPEFIPKGESDVGDTKELLGIIKYFKENN